MNFPADPACQAASQTACSQVGRLRPLALERRIPVYERSAGTFCVKIYPKNPGSMVTPVSVTVSCTALSETILQKAQELAKKLCLPFCLPDSCQSRYLLTLTESRLELGINPVHAEGAAFSPLFVDFLGGGVAYRHLHNCTIKQPLARAVGIKPGIRPEVFDATAGLGGDGFVLACLGCQVILNERSGIVAALLADGMARAAMEPRTAETIRSRMRLLTGEARDNLRLLPHPPSTVYLDPMYPHSAKSALNKKEMRMIRDIVGDDPDSAELLYISLAHAANRVVVKRPKGAEHLGDLIPTHEILMKNSRFDVYLTHHL